MKLNKPKFWNNKYSFTAFLLLPITIIVILFIFLKRYFTKTVKFNFPVICVGNIYIGGTGKTPSSILIANELSKLGKNPAIVRKFYEDHQDEHSLIKENFKSLILCENRIEGIAKAKKLSHDSVILDDGFQDLSVKKSLSILCFNHNQLIGNGFILPSGPLRESLKSLKKAEVILINGKKDINFEKKILKINKNLEIFYSNYIPLNIEQFRGHKLFAIAGIGNPENFFQLLLQNDLNIEKKIIYPDHYKFSKNEFLSIIEKAKISNCQIIMTEKDYFKVKDFNLHNIKYLKVDLKINEKEKLFKKIYKLYDQNN